MILLDAIFALLILKFCGEQGVQVCILIAALSVIRMAGLFRSIVISAMSDEEEN